MDWMAHDDCRILMQHKLNISDSRSNYIREKPDVQLCFVDAIHVTVNKAMRVHKHSRDFSGAKSNQNALRQAVCECPPNAHLPTPP